jgi:hypothetical protein
MAFWHGFLFGMLIGFSLIGYLTYIVIRSYHIQIKG